MIQGRERRGLCLAGDRQGGDPFVSGMKRGNEKVRPCSREMIHFCSMKRCRMSMEARGQRKEITYVKDCGTEEEFRMDTGRK